MDKIIVYNPRNGSEINETYAQNKWKHEVNKIIKYDAPLAKYLLGKYGFLLEVEPKDLPDVKKLSEAQFFCDFPGCGYVTDTQQKLNTHILGKHKITQEVQESYDGVEEAKPVGKVEGKQPRKLTPEQLEGIPDTSRGEVDGWYGEGLATDAIGSGMMVRKQPGVTPGHFN